MFVNRTSGIPNRITTMRTLSDDKGLQLAERDIEHQQYKTEQEQWRTAWESDRDQRAHVQNNGKAAEREQSNLQRRIAEE